MRITREERFWDKVEKTESCWIWKGTKSNWGYGIFWDGKKRILAHRYSYGIHEGIPNDCILHKCDVRLCVRPDHLFDGTRQENMKDMISKGRAYHPSMVGTWSKLDPILHEEIRNQYPSMTLHELGSKYNVSHGTIWKVVRHKYGEAA